MSPTVTPPAVSTAIRISTDATTASGSRGYATRPCSLILIASTTERLPGGPERERPVRILDRLAVGRQHVGEVDEQAGQAVLEHVAGSAAAAAHVALVDLGGLDEPEPQQPLAVVERRPAADAGAAFAVLVPDVIALDADGDKGRIRPQTGQAKCCSVSSSRSNSTTVAATVTART